MQLLHAVGMHRIHLDQLRQSFEAQPPAIAANAAVIALVAVTKRAVNMARQGTPAVGSSIGSTAATSTRYASSSSSSSSSQNMSQVQLANDGSQQRQQQPVITRELLLPMLLTLEKLSALSPAPIMLSSLVQAIGCCVELLSSGCEPRQLEPAVAEAALRAVLQLTGPTVQHLLLQQHVGAAGMSAASSAPPVDPELCARIMSLLA
jgi:hypothetical protein